MNTNNKMQSQVGLPLVFQYNGNNNTTQSHHHNVSLFGGGQKASYFSSNGVQQQPQHYGDTSFSSVSSQVKVQPPLSSFSSANMSSFSTLSSSSTNNTNNGNNNIMDVKGVSMNPAESYQQSTLHKQQGYESFR